MAFQLILPQVGLRYKEIWIMDEEKEKQKKERRFSQEQYDMLKRCSKAGDIKEWNEWRKENPGDNVLLEETNFPRAHLKGAYLNTCKVVDDDTNKIYEFSGEVHLENANFVGADLNEAKLVNAHLEGAKFSEPFDRANLEGASLGRAYLQGARFDETNLEGADFRLAVIDGSTSFWKCEVNKHCENSPGTNFEGVGLDSARIDSGTKQLLEYNIRRLNWEEWYKECWFWRWPVRAFWAMSDYGMNTLRVIGVFFILAFLFAAVYMNWGYWAPPGIVSNLVVQPEIGEAGWHYFSRALIRPIYFSVVTMTTLGFGDMYANKGSVAGHVLLILQVILGYVLLGALVTRFAVLFTAGGPAGKFAERKKETAE